MHRYIQFSWREYMCWMINAYDVWDYQFHWTYTYFISTQSKPTQGLSNIWWDIYIIGIVYLYKYYSSMSLYEWVLHYLENRTSLLVFDKKINNYRLKIILKHFSTKWNIGVSLKHHKHFLWSLQRIISWLNKLTTSCYVLKLWPYYSSNKIGI